MEPYKNQTSTPYWPWIEDMPIGDKGHIDKEAIVLVRDTKGNLTFYIEKYSSYLPGAGIEDPTFPLTRIADEVWDVDFSTVDTIYPLVAIHIDVFERNLKAFHEDYYGPFEFLHAPLKFDKSTIEVQYTVLAQHYDEILVNGDELEDEKITELQKKAKLIIPQYLKTASLQTTVKKLDCLSAWRIRDDDIAEYLEELLGPYIEEAAKEQTKLPISLMTLLINNNEEYLWEKFVQALPDERISEYAKYEFTSQGSDFESVVITIENVYGNYATPFGEKVYNWYTKVLIPLYEIEWNDYIKDADAVEEDDKYAQLRNEFLATKVINSDDLYFLIKKAQETEDYELLKEIRDTDHASALTK